VRSWETKGASQYKENSVKLPALPQWLKDKMKTVSSLPTDVGEYVISEVSYKCPTCKGTGSVKQTGLEGDVFLPDETMWCDNCAGRGFCFIRTNEPFAKENDK